MGTTLTPTGPVEGTVPACEGDVTYTWTYTDCAGFTHDYVHTVTITTGGLLCTITHHRCRGLLCGHRITNPSYRDRQLWDYSYAHRARGRDCTRL